MTLLRAVGCGLTCVVLGATASQHACAQMAMGAQQQKTGANQSIMASIMVPVPGEPYQATKVTHSVQKLGDGTTITHEAKGLIARDSLGRIREDVATESDASVDGTLTGTATRMVTVGDPVDHSILMWSDSSEDKTKMAMRMQMPNLAGLGGGKPNHAGPGGILGGLAPSTPPTPGQAVTAVSLGARTSKGDVKVEDLGKQSIEGLLVTGTRTTTTIAAGKIGNDRPIVSVHEEYRSPELQIIVKTYDKDPRTGEQTMELQGLVRTDPDIALFKAPAGYNVTDMGDMFKALGSIGRSKTE